MADHRMHVLLFITSRSEQSIDQAMVIVEKSDQENERGHFLKKEEEERILREAAEAGVDGAEIIGHLEVDPGIAAAMREECFYIG